MSILIDQSTKLVVQGLTGREGQFHGLRNKAYGTDLVAGVTPGKGGSDVEGTPIFNTVAEAVDATGANTSMVFVPPPFAADAILEAHDAGIETIVAITEGIPAMDMARAVNYIRRGSAGPQTGGSNGATLIGPNCPGVISPEKA
ncbi:MAG: succinate--CoA ligase subunit alpha, partial [Actinomycetota bacterium]